MRFPDLSRHRNILIVYPAIIVAWQLYATYSGTPGYILPAPSQILDAILVNAPRLATDSWVTTEETVIGFIVGVALGFLTAVAIVSFPFLRSTIMPGMVAFQSLPKVAVAPLIALWFGLGIEPKIINAMLLAYFPIAINVVAGLEQIDPDYIFLARVMLATKYQIFLKVRIPHAIPLFFEGLKIAMPFALVGAIIGEFVGAQRGLGVLLLIANTMFNTPLMFAGLFYIMIISFVLYGAIVVLERVLLPWRRVA